MADERGQVDTPGLAARAGKGLLGLVLTAVFGVALLAGGFLVLVWGEARVNIATAIDRAEDLNEKKADDGTAVTYRGFVSFATGAMDDQLAGGEYAYVERKVQTCAWTEAEKKVKDGKETVYQKAWVTDVPDSAKFGSKGYDNPRPALEGKIAVAEGIKVGDFAVQTVTEFDGARVVPPPKRHMDGDWSYGSQDDRSKDCAGGGALVGDQRVSFRVIAKDDQVIVFGKKDGASIQPFRGQVFLMLGSKDDLVNKKKGERASKTWIFRASGGLVLWIALYLIISPLLKVVTWIPLFGGIIKGAATAVTLVAGLGLTIAFVFFGVGMTFFTKLFGME